ncbi:MAG: DinB family protein [Luteolibacter sp.]
MSKPQLAAPGAGLPFPENLIARILLGVKRSAGKPQGFTAKFVAERELIRTLISNRSETALSTRVLIARPKGLEDSSRYWSVWMTLDHLRIVNHAFIGILESLSNEQVPEGKASTAAVKPDERVTAKVMTEYEESCDALLATIHHIRNFKTKAKFSHPWFGLMDAQGWLALSGGHMAIHRTQIKRILKGC